MRYVGSDKDFLILVCVCVCVCARARARQGIQSHKVLSVDPGTILGTVVKEDWN